MCVEFCVRVCKLHAAFEFLLRSGSGPSAGKEGERPPPRPHSSCLRLGVPGLCPALGQSLATAPSVLPLPYLTIWLHGDTTVMTIRGQHRTVSDSVPHEHTEG